VADKPARKKSHLHAGSNFQFAHSLNHAVVGLLKMSFTINSLKNAMPRREIAKDLPSFNYENVELKGTDWPWGVRNGM
jgi:hypothetical protein